MNVLKQRQGCRRLNRWYRMLYGLKNTHAQTHTIRASASYRCINSLMLLHLPHTPFTMYIQRVQRFSHLPTSAHICPTASPTSAQRIQRYPHRLPTLFYNDRHVATLYTPHIIDRIIVDAYCIALSPIDNIVPCNRRIPLSYTTPQ